MEAVKLDNVSFEEYLAIEQEADQRYEYHDGRIFAMAGGSLEHSEIGVNLTTGLKIGIREKGLKTLAFQNSKTRSRGFPI